MKIQALYHFEAFDGCFGHCEHNGHYSWHIYHLARQSGAGSPLEDFLHIHPKIYLLVRWFSDFKEFSISAETSSGCDEPEELFEHRCHLDCKYAFSQDMMIHDADANSETIDVCYIEKEEFSPDSREWEQGLESSLDHQIIDLLKGSQPVKLSIEKLNI